MAKRRSEKHAAYKLATRYDDATMEELKRCVKDGAFNYLYRQTRTRSICSAVVNGHDVYFVLARPNNGIVTVLTEEQARSQIY